MKHEEARNEANRLVRKAKYEYERSIAINMQEDSKIFWKFIQSKTKTKENSPCIIDEQGEINTDDRIKAELMNTFSKCLHCRSRQSKRSNARSKNRRKTINDQIQPKICTITSGEAKSY